MPAKASYTFDNSLPDSQGHMLQHQHGRWHDFDLCAAQRGTPCVSMWLEVNRKSNFLWIVKSGVYAFRICIGINSAGLHQKALIASSDC
jgi:hypothetical protein